MPNSNSKTPSATLPRARRVLHLSSLLLVAATIGNCSNTSTPVNLPGTGGAPSSGGASATGGATASGGTTTTGGAPSTGGSIVTGGLATTGGVTANGGSISTGGSAKNDASPPRTGGATTGGVTSSGGSGQTGGTTSAGGVGGADTGTSNRDASDGPGSGGAPRTGGATGTGGVTSSGGTSSKGGTTGTGGTSGGDAGTTPANCTAVPVTPNATQQTRNVLCYLNSLYGNGILSGQEEDNNDNGMNTVFAATGKYPAIRAFDVNNSQAPTQCVAHWNNGGLCMFGYHMGINGGTYNTKTNIDNVLTAGTAENTSFVANLDRIAQFVTPLKTAGGVAILRLFHEAGQGCSWFWWSMGTSAQWQSLFKYAFNYLTATKGLNNVLWLAPLCGQGPSSAYNPGPQYIDFGGSDIYKSAGDTEPLTSMFQQTVAAFPNMMVALHECGTIPDPDQLKSTATKWLLFNVWANPYFDAPYNTTAHLQAVYSNPYVITRDKLPSFK
jgi:Glycosyl hydrolase family 26